MQTKELNPAPAAGRKKYAKRSVNDLSRYQIGPVEKATAPPDNPNVKKTYMTPIYNVLLALAPFTQRHINCPEDLRRDIAANCKNFLKRKLPNDKRLFRFHFTKTGVLMVREK